MTWGDVEAPITAMGRAAAATLAFRVGGELRVVVVVKATFIMAPDAAMVRTDADPILRADQHRDRSPTSSLLASSDLVPYRPRADVLLAGHARASRDAPTPAMGVRLMVARGQEVVLDKRLAVRGTPDPTGRTRQPSPFAAMALAWELAASGPDNPVGIPEGPASWPHIVDPRHRERPAGFGPVSPRWPSRRRLLKIDERAFSAPVPDLPGDFAWAYFNAAPEDQRIDFLRGDEWIGFEGMNSQLPRVQSCLPGVRGVARVYGPTPQLLRGQPLPLEADTLTLDTDRLRCSVVWRGSLALASERDLPALQIVAGVGGAGETLSFPPEYVRPAPRAAVAPPPPPSSPRRAPDDETETRELPPNPPSRPHAEPHTATVAIDITAFAAAPATPFGPSTSPPRPIPQHLPAATPFERAREPEAGGTMDVAAILAGPALPFHDAGATMDVSALLSAPPLPFHPGPRSPPPAPPSPAAGAFDGGATMDVSALFAGSALPFHAAPAPAREVRATPPPAPPPSAGATMDVAALLAGPPAPLPFASRSPTAPPIPTAPRGPLFPEVARPVMPEPPQEPAVTASTPLATPEGEPPKTLGGFFLAAMAAANHVAGP